MQGPKSVVATEKSGAEGYLRVSPLLRLLRRLLVWTLGALLGVLRGRRDGECWRDGGIGGDVGAPKF